MEINGLLCFVTLKLYFYFKCVFCILASIVLPSLIVLSFKDKILLELLQITFLNDKAFTSLVVKSVEVEEIYREEQTQQLDITPYHPMASAYNYQIS